MKIPKILGKLSVSLLFMTIGVQTWASVQFLVVNFKDGSKVSFALADDPVVKNTASELTVETDSRSVAVSFADLDSYNLSETDPLSAIDEVPLSDAIHKYDGNCISFTGAKPHSTIIVYGVDGQVRTGVRADNNGNASIDVSCLPAGIYIVKNNTCSFKFHKQ